MSARTISYELPGKWKTPPFQPPRFPLSHSSRYCLVWKGSTRTSLESINPVIQGGTPALLSVRQELFRRGDHLVLARQHEVLERRRIRRRHVERADAPHRRIEILECLLRDACRELRARTTGQRRLVKDDHPIRFGHRLEDRLLVE